ncbi:MAG: RidA family protein [Microscillaceae bacterium]|nr:RidA family protein [Microscillaceae bacterium]
MKKIVKGIMVIVGCTSILFANQATAQSLKKSKMEKLVINPWQWQDNLSYVQAVEVKNVQGTLYVSGQAAVHPDGTSSNADMRTQLGIAIQNLEKVISQANYDPKNIVRLTVYTTSSEEFIKKCFDLFQDFVAKHGMKQTVTLMQVVALYETLNVELEATVVK